MSAAEAIFGLRGGTMSDHVAKELPSVQSPEVLLARLNRDLLRLRSAAAYLATAEPTLEREITALLRRTLVTEVLHDTYTVAVAGVQGAGKTTYVARMLGIHEDLLDGNLGRGERMPVLIVGDESVTEPTPVSRDVVEEIETDPLAPLTKVTYLNQEEWADTLDGKRDQSLLAELRVPVGQGLTHRRGLLLLPGYEKRVGEAVLWQDYMRQALAASSIAVVVVDQTRLADATQKTILSDIRKHLATATPIVVISKTEGLPEDKLAELVATAGEIFEIPTHDRKRGILVTGSGSDPGNLRADLDSAIEALGSLSVESRGLQLGALRTLITEDLAGIIEGVDSGRTATRVVVGEAEENASLVMEAFDRGVERVRQDYRKALSDRLAVHRKTATKDVKSAHKDDIEGIENIHRRVYRLFADSAGDREERVEKMLTKAWKNADERESGFVPMYVDMLGDVIARRLAIEAPVRRFEPGPLDRRLPALPMGSDVSAEILPATVQHDVVLISEMGQDSVAKPTRDFQRAIEIMPVLALEFVRTAQIAPELVEVDPKTLAADKNVDAAQTAAAIGTAWAAWSTSQKALIATSATVFGLDLLVDGQIDTIPTLANAVTTGLSGVLPTGLASAAGVAVGAAVGVVAAGALTAIAIDQMRKSELRERESLGRAIAGISDANLAHYLDGFDDVMDATRQVLEARLRDWLHLNEDFVRAEWLGKTLADLRSRSDDLREMIDGNPITIVRPLPASP
jgi:hypothetical protein